MLGYVLASLLLLVATLYAFASYRVGAARSARYAPPTAALLPPDRTSAARGAHLVTVLGCNDCHTQDLGGGLVADAPPFRAAAVNLTRGAGGVGARLTPAAVEHAVRRGVGHDGRPLLVMPNYEALTDADVVALHTYLASLPPVDRPSEGVVIKPLGRMVFGLGGLPDHYPGRLERPAAPEARSPTGPTAEHGRYLAALTCVHCHGDDLRGAQPPNPTSPPAPSLEAASRWSEAQFTAALHEGRRPSGPALDAAYMPWKAFRHMSAEEVRALHAYLKQTLGSTTTARR